MWDNSTLIRFIKDRSLSLHEILLPQRPSLEENPLFVDRISRDQIRLREKLDQIQGTDQDDKLTGQIVEAITISGKVTPIPKDHPYSNQEIGDYLRHLDELEEWYNLRKFKRDNEEYNPYVQIDYIPILSCIYSTDKKEHILVMSINDNNVTELNTDTMSNVVGNKYRNQYGNYRRSNYDDIDSLLINVDFEELRKRLINSGYSELVNELNEHLQHY